MVLVLHGFISPMSIALIVFIEKPGFQTIPIPQQTLYSWKRTKFQDFFHIFQFLMESEISDMIFSDILMWNNYQKFLKSIFIGQVVVPKSNDWFYNFSITQILREIAFRDFRSTKPAIFTHLEAVNLDFDEFLHFLTTGIYQINKIQRP